MEEEKWLNTKASARYLGVSKAGFLKIVQREGIIHETRQGPYGEEHLYQIRELDRIKGQIKGAGKRTTEVVQLPSQLTRSTNGVTAFQDKVLQERLAGLVEAVERLVVAQKENTDRLIKSIQNQQKVLEEAKVQKGNDTASSELQAKVDNLSRSQKNQTWVYIILLIVLVGGAVGIAWAGVTYLNLLLR